jgi:hypothetical protein
MYILIISIYLINIYLQQVIFLFVYIIINVHNLELKTVSFSIGRTLGLGENSVDNLCLCWLYVSLHF